MGKAGGMLMRRAAPSAKPKAPKPRRCAVRSCRREFTPRTGFQVWCSPDCGAAIGAARLAEKQAKERRAQKSADRAALERMKPLPVLIGEAQEAVNRYIRYRDRHQACIDCGLPFEPQRAGGSVDAGHFISRSAAPHLRFDRSNIHAQRKNCNRPGGTTAAAMRAGVVARIGESEVLRLEAAQHAPPVKWTRDEVRAIRDQATADLRAAKKAAKGAQ